ncbi:MAG: hypothetical protein M3552_13545 [Planctomycetota bacterium]|nr:hypothetical protein [Planctomycetaceae bacterium]MDQ3331657.1 hypothetical protein [Planctomycetota bacterium]
MTRDFDSPEETRRLDRMREQIAAELPELQLKGQRLRDAAEEPTLSGELRQAVHTSDISLMELVRRASIDPLVLDSFLTGDATLPSDAMDRLAAVLGCVLARIPSSKAS